VSVWDVSSRKSETTWQPFTTLVWHKLRGQRRREDYYSLFWERRPKIDTIFLSHGGVITTTKKSKVVPDVTKNTTAIALSPIDFRCHQLTTQLSVLPLLMNHLIVWFPLLSSFLLW
jgi:hypothetical protein